MDALEVLEGEVPENNGLGKKPRSGWGKGEKGELFAVAHERNFQCSTPLNGQAPKADQDFRTITEVYRRSSGSGLDGVNKRAGGILDRGICHISCP